MARNLGKRRNAPAPSLKPRQLARYWWNQLTSMRTALVLLFCLAVAAIPGSVVPQRSIDPVQVEQFIGENPRLGEFYERIGMFEVFSSPWFSAIYLLLFVSLIGCIVPRVLTYARAMRAEPVRTPARLTRLPNHRVGAAGAGEDADEVVARSADWLRRRRYRVAVRGTTVSAERGYLREAGNLVFHLSLVFLLVGVALGTLYGYRGTSIVVVGQGFSNVVTQYDDLSSGPRFTPGDLSPFQVKVDDFDAEFEAGPVQTGAARLFRADTTVIDRPGADPRHEVVEVNHPLNVGGAQVHMLGHGYAPTVTVRDANGDVAWSGPVVFLPQDGNFTSFGVVNAVDARPERLALQGYFLPTGDVEAYGPISRFPDLIKPQLVLTGYYGPPREETGAPQNVYSLDTTDLTQFRSGDEPYRTHLEPGDTVELPDGKGSVTFDGVDRWVRLQVSRTPGLPLTAGAISFSVVGLCFSLFVRPRRLWIRVGEDGDDPVRVEAAGLDRADARTGLDEEVAALADVATGAEEGTDSGPSGDGEYRDDERDSREDE